MQLLADLCLALFVVTVTTAGTRMLLLARRTRKLPELLVGSGSVLVAGLGLPASVASGFGQAKAEVNVPLWIASEFVTQVGILCLYLFTQRVFRPGVGWARALVAGAACFLPAGLAGAGHALAGAAPELGSVQLTRGWLLLCYGGYTGAFVWSAFEGLHHHRRALRRLSLGLGDPVVANRFLLWALYGLAATGVILANAVGVALGYSPSSSPVILLPMGVFGLAASAAMYLAFLPPVWYLGRLRARGGGSHDVGRAGQGLAQH